MSRQAQGYNFYFKIISFRVDNMRKMGEDVFFYLGSLTLGVESPTENMNFLYNDPSENRMEFTKLKVACKYASIERGYVYN